MKTIAFACALLLTLSVQCSHAQLPSTLSESETSLVMKQLKAITNTLRRGKVHRIFLMPKISLPDPTDSFAGKEVRAESSQVGAIDERDVATFLSLLDKPERITALDSGAVILGIPLMRAAATEPQLILQMQFYGDKLALQIRVEGKDSFQADAVYGNKLYSMIRSRIVDLAK